MKVMRQTACLMVNPITVNNFTDLFICKPVDQASDNDGCGKSFQLNCLGHDDLSLVGPAGVQLWFNCWTFVLPTFQSWFAVEYSSCFISVMDLCFYMFAVLIHWWIEVLNADRTTSMRIWTTEELMVRLLQRIASLSPVPHPVIYYWPFQGDASDVVYSNCQCSSAFCLALTYCSIYLE